MTYEQELSLARLQGTLRGTRLCVQAHIRVNHSLSITWTGTALGDAYRYGIPSLVGTLLNVRQAERELDAFIKGVENV